MEDTGGSRVAIVGGSIAGCAAAVALQRAGCDVEIFERSSGELRDRGSGIAIPITLRDQLVAAGYLEADYPSCPAAERWWMLADGSRAGRTLWRQASDAAMNNWGVLWRSLRERIDDSTYHDGVSLESVEQRPEGVEVSLSDGSTREFDVLVGADGYRSRVRRLVHPDSRPEYSGYILWRGNYPEDRVQDRSALDRADESRAWYTTCFDGGHGVSYMIPNFDDRTDPGHRRVNWAIYAPQPAELDFSEPSSLAPGQVDESLYAHLDRLLSDHFPPEHEQLVRNSPRAEVSIQPIYDEVVDSYVRGRVLLIGDAGTVSRPHTGSGATKALQDALALERLASAHRTWKPLLAAYDAERSDAGRSLVEMGRRIGRAQVERTPDWASMEPGDFDAWTKSTLAGDELYFWGETKITS